MAVIGIDLGGTKLAVALFSDQGSLLRRAVVQIERRVGIQVGSLVAEQANALAGQAVDDGHQVTAVGISVPGIARADTGRVWAPNIPGWEDYPLRVELERAVRAEISIDSDRACSILGETWQGCARGTRNAIFLAVGTGIGAGILVDGKVLRGQHDIAGAIGWLALDRPYRSEYDGVGCFEYHASGAGLARIARASTNDLLLWGKPSHEITAHDVFDAYSRNDSLACRVIDDAVVYWGMAIANLVSLFNPEMVILGGGIFGPAAPLLDRIREEAAHWAQPISMQHVILRVSELGPDAALYGAARLALKSTTP